MNTHLGILTPGSSYSPQPSHPDLRAETVAIFAAFVTSHSGGAVLDSHQLPWCVVTEAMTYTDGAYTASPHAPSSIYSPRDSKT